jgi:hypothetical protein
VEYPLIVPQGHCWAIGQISSLDCKPRPNAEPRRLQESDLSTSQISKLKGTGKDGMLTKGDVLVALGKLKNPFGSAEKLNTDTLGPSGKRASEVGRVVSGREFSSYPLIKTLEPLLTDVGDSSLELDFECLSADCES